MIDQMIFFTQLEAGTLTREYVQESGGPAQIWAILTSSVSLAREFIYRNRDATVRIDQRDGDISVMCHLQALKHAFAELVTNAINFSPEDSEVLISEWVADGAIWINIVDQGSGMTDQQLNSAFQDFYQIDRETKEQQGMGLGLPLARRIVEAHNGMLQLTSIVGKGTQVILQLPVYEE
jgi:signal transduction histidine kinase